MTPSWYDLLDVDPRATEEEVRAAWRASIAGLDPTDRRFAVRNEAAAVLLDPVRRAAYDRDLGLVDAPEAAPEPDEEPEPEPEQEPKQEEEPEPQAARPSGPAPDGGQAERAPRPPLWVLAVLGGLTLVMAVAAVLVAATVPSDDEVAAATQEAQAAAERAIVPVLSYDHRTLEQDRTDAVAHLTEDFREEYERLFTSQIEENAAATRAVVEAEVRASAITRGGHARARVLLFVDQRTTNARTSEPVTYRNQVTVTMERVGDRWLVDDLRTSAGD